MFVIFIKDQAVFDVNDAIGVGCKFFIVRDDDVLRVIDCAEVMSIRADDNQVLLHTRTADWALREPLSALLERLNYPDFLRVHRSALVNKAQITHLDDGHVVLKNKQRVEISRRKKEEVMKALAG